MADKESLLETVEDLGGGRIFFEVVTAKLFFHLVLDVERQPMLEQARDLTTILSVTIAHTEEVAVLEAHDVRCQIALDGVEADIVRVGTGTAVHPGGGADGDDQATGTKCGSGDHIDKSSGIRGGPESGP